MAAFELERKDVIALKSMRHFRAAFETILAQIVVCDSGALCTLHYERLPKPEFTEATFPLDQDAGWTGRSLI